MGDVIQFPNKGNGVIKVEAKLNLATDVEQEMAAIRMQRILDALARINLLFKDMKNEATK